MKDKGPVSERFVAQIWKGLRRRSFFSGEGGEINVVYPGRENRDRGPDFNDAIIARGGELITGDVELHVRASDWRAHGHDRDPRYNGVILQVVFWNDEQVPTVLENGKAMPTLALAQWFGGSLEEVDHWSSQPLVPDEPCYHAVGHLSDAVVGRLLDEAGEQRFQLKAARFRERIAEGEAEQALYQGLMRALGYAKNKEQFQELASRLPISVLHGLVRGREKDRLIIQALLLGTAGLLPSQRGIEADEAAVELQRMWRFCDGVAPMDCAQWHLFRVRPENFPTRRLMAASYLLGRFLEKGLLRGVLELVPKGQKELEAGFMVAAADYWGRHFDFGCRVRNSNLIGRGRARDIIVNVVLPFTFAWAELNSQPELGKQALNLYRHQPKLGDNEITRELTGLLLGGDGSDVVNSAMRQQGLIHLFQSFCRERKCAQCPIATLHPI